MSIVAIIALCVGSLGMSIITWLQLLEPVVKDSGECVADWKVLKSESRYATPEENAKGVQSVQTGFLVCLVIVLLVALF